MKSVAGEAWFSNLGLQRVLALLNADGGEGRVVGGAVRNSLLGMPVGDIDLASTLVPDEVIARAKALNIKCVPTGYEHGTVTLVIDGVGFEVTTLRTDVETDGRHAQVAFGTDWLEDANRRDLTINALYADIDGNIIDLVGGIADLEKRNIRFIGDAERRVSEDYLRVLRFFRFFAYYGSGRPDADGLRACARAKDQLLSLSVERIWSEMKKLLAAPDPTRSLLWMRQVGVLTVLLPETEKWGIDSIHGLVEAENALNWDADSLLRLASIIPNDRQRVSDLAKRMRMSKAETNQLDQWVTSPSIDLAVNETALDRLMYTHGKQGIVMKLRLQLAKARSNLEMSADAMQTVGHYARLLARALQFEKPKFPLTGADVIALGIKPGPEVGEILSQIEQKWLGMNFVYSREALLAQLRDKLQIH